MKKSRTVMKEPMRVDEEDVEQMGMQLGTWGTDAANKVQHAFSTPKEVLSCHIGEAHGHHKINTTYLWLKINWRGK
ncbi:hypothetical protein LR48_Vigan304s003600 [Vigna angularis]|uniref:Uncharacterized protein n=1 Tax=Phaseolus angularis TaxID=3914 RepID=A0A0L9T9A9_PHAAN|nr:hypothetical protein LR48_Vigan304s003600 [Vigna angularis]